MKKVLSIVLAVVMLCSTFAGIQLTANAAMPSSGKCGDNVTYTFNSKSGLLTISGSGDMYDYDAIDDQYSPFYNQSSVIKVEIKSGVTSIGKAVFELCDELQSVSIPETVKHIGFATFLGCYKLENITLPTALATIDAYAFSDCTTLTSVVIPASVSEISHSVFSGCESLESIKVDTNNTEYDSRNDCDAIIETESNTLIAGCKNTVIPNTITVLGESAFGGCHDLKAIAIPNSVESILGNAFADCTGLTSVVIPNSVKVIDGYAFLGCSNLKSFTVSASVEEISPYVFCYCYALRNITVDKANRVYDSRNNCNAIIETASNTLVFGCNYSVIPNSVVAIGEAAFLYNETLTSVSIPSSVTVIKGEAFYGCDSLVNVYYSGSSAQWKKIKVGGMNQAFKSAHVYYYYNAKSLKFFHCTARTAAAEKVEWNKVAGAAGYQVQISNAAGNKWAKAYNVTGTSFVFKNLAAGSNYKFRVRFYKKTAGGKVVLSDWSKTLASPTLPKATSLTKLVGGKNCFAAQWRRTAVTGYQIQYSTNAKFTGAKIVTVRNAKAYKTLVNKLAEKKVYFVRARTYKTFAKVNYFSTWSKTYKVKTK